jgi:tetratricopeptide (TPR) repeat protein
MTSCVLYAHGVLFCAQEEIFLRSNALYNQHSYQEALQLYDTLNNKGAAVWYNMGQCSIELQQYGQARLFFERAQGTASRKLYSAIKKNVADIINHMHCKEYSCTIDAFIARIQNYSRTVPLLLLQLLFLGV